MYASDVIKVAEDQIGYIEKASDANLDSKTGNAGSNNHTKYGRDLHKAGYYNGDKCGYPWCDQFVDWCFYIAANKSKTLAEKIQCQTGPYGAGCGCSAEYYAKQGRLDKTPKVGDQVFFRYAGTTSGADHTGLVVEVTDTQVVTIEGNSNNRVQKRTYKRSDPTLYAFGHPIYDAPVAPKPATPKIVVCNIELQQLSKGSTGKEVKTLQRLLRQLGYKDQNGNALQVDGDFGSKTEYALKAFQNAYGIGADGVCGIKTWTKLLKG